MQQGFDVPTALMSCHLIHISRSFDAKYEENENFTYLEDVDQNGYIWKSNGDLQKDSLPPMSFTYAKNPFNQEVQILPSDSLHIHFSGIRQWRISLDGFPFLSGISEYR
ncbi:MAG: hypothetical protein IPJ39_22765 [Saprospiraceae bacterium]|nr:hypothetical protein [Saprospiraceae bacterium]